MDTVTVVILNYNGLACLERCVESVLRLDWPDLDVCVVDNASTDGAAAIVAERHGGRVRVIRREVNSATAARNDGFRSAHSPYVLSLDNDMVLPDPYTVGKAVELLETYPNAAALAFKIGSEDTPDHPLAEHWWHPVPLESGENRLFYSDWFPEGAVFFRKSALDLTGGYEEELVHGFECSDLALRILDHGLDILYAPSLHSIELRVRGFQHTSRSRMNYLCLRNKLWTAWKDYPAGRGLWYGATRIVAGGLRAARFGWLDLWARAVKDGILAPRGLRAKRQAIAPATWARIRRIQRGQYRQVEHPF